MIKYISWPNFCILVEAELARRTAIAIAAHQPIPTYAAVEVDVRAKAVSEGFTVALGPG